MPSPANRRRRPPSAASVTQPFHRRGLAYFWVLNDRCNWAEMEPQLEAFAAAGDVSALCLHPRPGLLVPYGGGEWFDLIRRICVRARQLGLRIWLYDEDPYPSGNAGGRLIAENPGLLARGLRLYTYDPGMQGDASLFCFPTGNLIWCGLVNEVTGETQELTERVGILRRRWEIHERWDSRFFYPDTPRYTTPRADTKDPEFALTVPVMPPGMKLLAVVARPGLCAEWGPFGQQMDTLHPKSAQLFLASTHEKYWKSMGDMFGREIEAIFTDEPKFFDPWPWTPGLFEDFQKQQGYDIRPYLHYLWSDSTGARARLTRLHYRYHAAQRFLDAWLRPVADWCRDHKLKLVGHLSPEDDPVEQAPFLGNAMPVLKEFDLCGLDLIIPAVGDRRHPILSVGVTCATSIAQQRLKQGVMSETGACSPGITPAAINRIHLWQNMMGVTAPLVHCAYGSVRGPRAYEYPPNYGPNGDLWGDMVKLHPKLAEVQAVTHGARQLAPVAILWPIRSFCADKFEGQADHTGLRAELFALLAACLDRQVGTHFIDEADLADLEVKNGEARLGNARYTHILVPSCTVLLADTEKTLRNLQRQGLTVLLAGRGPDQVQERRGLRAATWDSWCPRLAPAAAAAALPRLLELPGDGTDIRCTAWVPPGGKAPVLLLMNLRSAACVVRIGARRLKLEPGVVYKV